MSLYCGYIGNVCRSCLMILLFLTYLYRWKLGQLAPGCTVQFKRISWQISRERIFLREEWLKAVEKICVEDDEDFVASFDLMETDVEDISYSPILYNVSGSDDRPDHKVALRQVNHVL